ncbi:hypothetical protein JF541_12055 [Marinobacter hydrocarbonoclasticus]|uniref:hypothetical protein n=1 Tax=Marinobacter nauticus TaxID=2743 RepID=UPI001A907FA1|nr:hypothetical protein [Marinobacter nauticus]MBN8239887.1 hypothetical protein [Marinobacter nauticus]
MEYQYLGWIPCISGHLDFGLMKPGISGGFTNKDIKDNKTNHINFGYLAQKDHHARRVMLQSKVNWQDRLNDKDYDGSFRVFVIAEASENACMDNRELHGSVYIYPTGEQEGSKAQNREKPWFQTIHEAQETYDRSNGNVDGWDESRSQLNRCYDRLKEELKAMGFWRVDFKATSGGLVYLSTPTEQHRPLSDNEKYLITRQAYYYIKYSLHSHKHHQAEQDSLTTIVPYDPSTDGKRDAALKMLCQLKRELTHIKRTLTQEQGLYSDDALGILSYMGSLLTTLHTRKLIDGDLYQREGRYIDSLRGSFQVQESRTRNFRSIEDSIRSTNRVYFGWGLALLSLFFGIIARPFYAPVPDNELLPLPSLWDVVLFVTLGLLVIKLVYTRLTTYMINTKLDEASVRHFVQARYHLSGSHLIRSFLEDNKKAIYVLLLLVLGAVVAALV